MQCTENGFQTLEVLREGLWASFTGGWFYDLRQNVFCNTFHLYLWLFLLCFPFIVHLYFPPSPLVSSFYCSTVGIVFIFLKLINHRLHRMFDTTECIQESIPGEDLPESQKKRTQFAGAKALLEDEWFELKELNGSKVTSDIPSHASFRGGTDDDSINSSEATGRPISSTIDLKVDVHHKNSSESSEDLSLKPVLEDEAVALTESEQCGLLKEGVVKTPDLVPSNFRSKSNQLNSNKLRLKNEESISSIQDSDLIFSQSDCHIAKLRNDSMDNLSEDYKISQSECHISKFFHGSDKDQAIVENNPCLPEGTKKFHCKNKDHSKKKYRKGFSRHLGADMQNENKSVSSDKNVCFETGNFASNGSCGVLTLGQNNKEQIKNTGSLELPLKDTDNSNLEKGLLYWKQQNFDNNRVDNLREAQTALLRPCNKLHVCSEINIHSADRVDVDNSIKRLNKTIDLCDIEKRDGQEENEFQNSSSYHYQDVSLSEQNSEQSFLEILEENFDWYSSEYQSEKSDKMNYGKGKGKDGSKFVSEESIQEEEEGEEEEEAETKKKKKKKKLEYLPTGSDVKFRVDSDEDSSDNCGSRSPLLCRHESLEKENQERKGFFYGEKSDGGNKMARTFSNEESNGSRSFNKMVRTLSADEDVVLSRRYKTSEVLPKMERGAFGSVLLSVYDDDDLKKYKDGKRLCRKKDGNDGKDWRSRSCKSVARKPSSLYSNKKLSLTSPVRVDESRVKKKEDKLTNKDVLSWSNERVGLEWLFEHTDSETDNQTGKTDGTKNGSNLGRGSMSQSQGGVSKGRSKTGSKHRSYDEPGKGGKLERGRMDSFSDEFDNFDRVGQVPQKESSKKSKSERENGIIDEEDAAALPATAFRDPSDGGGIVPDNEEEEEEEEEEEDKQLRERELSRRENYDSSSNSNFELSSLLPLSSLLSSLNPPSSPLLAAFLATRKDLPGASQHPGIEVLATAAEKDVKPAPADEAPPYHPALTRNRHKRIKRPNKFQRSSRSSIPLAALASIVSNNSGTHIATSHDDTSQGAVHCFQDERGNWNSYIFFDCFRGDVSLVPTAVPLASCSNSNDECNAAAKAAEPHPDGADPSALRQFFAQNGRDKEGNPSSSSSSGGRPEEGTRRKGDAGSGRSKAGTSQGRSKHQKYGETCDSNVNLMSNSNSENDSSLSLNSTNVSPNVDGRLRRPSFGFGRERAAVAHCSTAGNPNNNNNAATTSANSNNNNNNNNNSNNNNNNTSIDSSSGPIDLSLSEFRSSDNNNNNNNGRNSNFYLEGPYDLLTDAVLGASYATPRQRNYPHSPTGVPDFCLSLNAIQDGNESEPRRNHFCLFNLRLESGSEVKKKRRHYYKLYYTPWNYLKIRFDRLELIALLDRNLTFFEVALSLLLSLAVSACGITLLNYGFYRDLVALLFCFTIAGCHYSLLKSVQPDATSPTHGYNRVVIYSRSIYFCLATVLIMALTSSLDKKESEPFNFYNLQITDNQLFRVLRDGLLHVLLLFPMLFTLGVFPQINTFSLYLLEQVDVHVLGGNAMSNLIGAAYCVARSIASVVLVYGFAYGALSEAKTSQHILFSIFSGLLIAISYHLSRSSSNPNIMWEIVKAQVLQDDAAPGPGRSDAPAGRKPDDPVKADAKTRRDDGDDKSDDKNSQNNLLLNSNPSSNETLKTIDTHVKSNFSENSAGNASDVYNVKKDSDKEFVDPLPGKLKDTVNARLKNDAIVCCFVAVLVFGLHSSTVFTALQPDLNPILWGIAGCSGVVLHYIVPQLRKQLPWLCLARPVLRSHEHSQFEVRDAAKVMWFEETYVILCFLERNLLYPVLVLATLTYDGPRICSSLGVPLGALVTTVCGLKMMRSAFSNTSQQYLIVIFTALLFEFDYQYYRKTFLIDYFFIGIVFSKTYEFLLKMQFVVTYIAPWQITWGSTFHAFAQLFSVPHSAFLLFQTAVSALLSAPLNPFLGSALFFASYVRPVKFWERDYNTKRVDHSNTRLSSHLERNLGSDDNNLNSIFYEHLTRSLQHNLCGDLELGRWGPAYQGDCFILASDYLNCLVHIIEMGNGLVTFQMRGLEFRGTFCQQREVEAISEGVEENDGCCCCQPGHLPNILSVNAAFSQRWLAWEVTSTKYVLEGYSISDNSAKSLLQVFDFRKDLVTYYVKSIIFYCIRSPKLVDWLSNSTILAALEPISDRSFVDLDPVFNVNIDQDFDMRAEGITRASFCNVYLEWIQYCSSKRDKPIDKSKDSPLISLCLALSLMGRRTLGTASHNTVSNVEFFLYGLHALFKGDFRITSTRDEWIFYDMEFLKKVVAPGVRMSLKLHQDHFMSPEEYENPGALYEAISNHEENLVISHEGDPIWRGAVLSGTPSLLTLRHVLDDGADEYKIIMLNKRFLSFRVIKLNRECVRGLWAGQQQELVFFRNRNPERGSIQNAKQVLRNIINSSCDQPIGYPIYVSPLTTSYSDTNKQFTDVIGGPLSLQGLKTTALKLWRRIRQRCREGCSSGSAGNVDDGGFTFGHDGNHASPNVNVSTGYGHNTSGSQSMDSSQMQLGGSNRGGSLGRSSLGGRGSLPSVGKPSSATLASLAGLLSSAELSKGEGFLRERETSFTFIKERALREEKEASKKMEDARKMDDLKMRLDERERRRGVGVGEEEDGGGGGGGGGETRSRDKSDDGKDHVCQRVRIIDPNQVFDAINLGRRIDVLWPDEGMRARGGRSHWKDWLPDTGMEGQVVHRWIPNHRDPSKRSNVDKTILLVKIEDRFVPIAEAGVQDLGAEV